MENFDLGVWRSKESLTDFFLKENSGTEETELKSCKPHTSSY